MRYIGIDIGDGESAVALLEENSVIEPVIQPIDGRGSIISVVGMSGNDIRIGENALLDRKVLHLRSRFKSRFLTALESEMDIERFASGLKQELVKDAPDLFDDTYVTVGCPAGWKPRDRERYKDIMKKAGFDNVHIVSESRAAFFYARYAHGLNVSPELLRKTTLVIDIGSSTTDFAYIINGRESDVGTFGDVALGGGLIEQCMLEKAVHKSPNREALEDVFKESPSWKNRCEIVARRLKEQYFLDEKKWLTTPCVASEMIYYDEPVKIRFELSDEIVSDIISTPIKELGGATFQECLSDLMRHAVAATKDDPPKLIILTGGASRMRFFREACAAAFADAEVVICPEPEYSIAKGLAYAARIDKRLEDFHTDIQQYFESGDIRAKVNDSLEWLTVPMASVLSGRIVSDVVLDVMERRKQGEIKTIADMDTPIVQGTDRLLRDLDEIEELQPVVREWCRKLFLTLQPEIDEICRRHNVDRSSMTLSAVHSMNGLESMNICLEGRFVSTVTCLITGAVSASLCSGTGIALISEGPVGIIIGAVIGIAIGYLGKKAVDTKVRGAELPGAMRKVIGWSLKKNLSSARQRKAIEDELVKTMNTGDFLTQLVDDVTISLESQIREMARSVEMPIVQ